LVTGDRAWQAQPLPIEPASTVGAGDSFLSAIIWALTSKMGLEESFRYAVAAGSAALLAPGTELCRAQDVRDLLSQVGSRRLRFDHRDGASTAA
jgi:6-phosphofructokinase 2